MKAGNAIGFDSKLPSLETELKIIGTGRYPTFVTVLGSVAGSMSTSGVSSMPFDGLFIYCVKPSDVITDPNMPGALDCSLNNAAVYKSCSSKNHRVVLTRQ